MTIYEYNIEGKELIKQGDIFTNIPYFSFDFLVKSSYLDDKPLDNQYEEIIEGILKSGNVFQIETFISSTSAILASQDCDIEQGNYLIFFPLKKYEPFESKNNILNYFNKIREFLVQFYLPKINNPNFGESGPFTALFRTPITVPKGLIIKNHKYCWMGRIKDIPKKFFLDKLVHFYCRPPIEELIFATNKEIKLYISKNEGLERNDLIERIKIALYSCDRKEDFLKICKDLDIIIK